MRECTHLNDSETQYQEKNPTLVFHRLWERRRPVETILCVAALFFPWPLHIAERCDTTDDGWPQEVRRPPHRVAAEWPPNLL